MGILLNDDFRNHMDELKKADLIATDPPYNINFGSYNEYEDDLTDDDYIELISHLEGLPLAIIHYPEETMKYFVPALGVPDEVIVWCYNSNIPRQSRLINFYNVDVDFDAVKQPYKNPNDKRIKKLIAKGSKGTRSYDWFSDVQLVKNVSKEKTIHPCPVPVELMERIIKFASDRGDLVADPFMGCGTTAVAAMNTGREYIGFEIDHEYHKTSVARVMENDSE